jgi:predicted transposase YbfD/YdcC
MLSLAQNIKNLDRKKNLLSADIHCRKSLADRSRQSGFNEMVLTKLQTKIEQHVMVDRELEKCLNLAKYIQLRGFQNEIARTSGH